MLPRGFFHGAQITERSNLWEKRTHIFLILCMGFMAFYWAFSHQRKLPAYHWQSWLWADQTGYYIYLPATFIYQWQAELLPADIIDKTGNGFERYPENKIFTRYTAGVSYFQLPFFLIAHALSYRDGFPGNGFSDVYIYAQIASGAFWGTLGLLFLYGFISRKWNRRTGIISTVVCWAGTPLLFYHAYGNGMSHIYGFGLIAFILWYVEQRQFFKWHDWFVIGLMSGWLVLIRPTHAITIIVILVYFILEGRQYLWRSLLHPLHIAILIFAVFMLWLPQFLYWHHLSSQWFMDSYAGYGFTHLSDPEVLKFWFSPRNGLFVYAPFMMILVVIFLYQIYHRQGSAWLMFGFFLFFSYIFSSWFMWYFGCGFGSRNFVDIMPLLILPFSDFLFRIRIRWYSGLGFFLILMLSVGLTFKLTHASGKCFTGKGDWDWAEYRFGLFRQSHMVSLSDIDIAANATYSTVYEGNAGGRRYKEIEIFGKLESEISCSEVFWVVTGSHGGNRRIYRQTDICVSEMGDFHAYFEVDDTIRSSMEWKVYLWNYGGYDVGFRGGKLRFW